MKLSSHQQDRAIGAILASAAGDALGAPYEFEPPIPASQPVVMNGGGAFGWAPGEWTDDTSMAIPILRLLANGRDLADESSLDELTAAWVDWAKTAPDVGMQTRTILSGLSPATAAEARERSSALHASSGRTGGNGSLMRTGPVGIATLESAEATAKNARAIGELTHWDPVAGDACVLWCVAIRHAVLTGELDVRQGLHLLPAERLDYWVGLIEDAEANEPSYFAKNGWVVHAFQAAWSAICKAKQASKELAPLEADRMRLGLEYAVRAGFDTDTVAAIAGSLLGAAYGSTAIPAEWRLKLHGWPGIGEGELVSMTYLALNGGQSHSNGWPMAPHFNYDEFGDRFEFVQHPHDSGVWLGGVARLADLPQDITAVVSLCRVGSQDIPEHVEKHTRILLIDSSDPAKNLNVEFTILDAAAAVKALRNEGHKVFLHCVQSQSRTPSVAVAYSVTQLGIDLVEARADIQAALPHSYPNPLFSKVLDKLEPNERTD